jgi:hypothetical protein
MSNIKEHQTERKTTTRGRVSEVIAAIALALALILIVDTITAHGGPGFLGMNPQQVGRSFGMTSILLFFSAFGVGFRQKSSITTGLLIGAGGLYLVYLIVGTVTMTVLFYYADPNIFYVFLVMSCIVLGLGLVRLFRRNPSPAIKAR